MSDLEIWVATLLFLEYQSNRNCKVHRLTEIIYFIWQSMTILTWKNVWKGSIRKYDLQFYSCLSLLLRLLLESAECVLYSFNETYLYPNNCSFADSLFLLNRRLFHHKKGLKHGIRLEKPCFTSKNTILRSWFPIDFPGYFEI